MMTCCSWLLILFLLLSGMATEILGSRLGECKKERAMTKQVQCSVDKDCAAPKKCCRTNGGGAMCEIPASNCHQLTCSRCKIDPYSGFALCVVDGNWGSWGSYGPCSSTCGGGTRNRHRLCNDPPPANGGCVCKGDNTETQVCSTNPCPVPGNWGAWGNFGLCSATCGGGTQERTRVCDNPLPANGGADCVGNSTETQDCNTNLCPVPGNWGEWGEYGPCSTCSAGGTQSRQRVCDSPSPSNGGADCAGDSTQTQNCGVECSKPFEEENQNGGWKVIQRRCNGCVLFNRPMAEYIAGFGNPVEEFWLGLDEMHQLTSNQAYELRVDLQLFDGTLRFAAYSNFNVGPSSGNYILGLGSMTSNNTRNSLIQNNQFPFSAPGSGDDCADLLDSGWWWPGQINGCGAVALNGQYQPSGSCPGSRCPVWIDSTGLYLVLKTTEMKIRPMSST